MAEISIDKSKTVVLMADFHKEGMGANPIAKKSNVLGKARNVLEAARKAGILVIYVVVNFREGYPEISDHNKAFSSRKKSGAIPPADPVDLICPEVAPQPGEPIVVKHRVNAFFGTDLDMILRARGIETLVLLGHATSGVILSTVRYAADADYDLIVVEDGCADHVPEVHKLLMERVFPRQAIVTTSEACVKAIAAS